MPGAQGIMRKTMVGKKADKAMACKTLMEGVGRIVAL